MSQPDEDPTLPAIATSASVASPPIDADEAEEFAYAAACTNNGITNKPVRRAADLAERAAGATIDATAAAAAAAAGATTRPLFKNLNLAKYTVDTYNDFLRPEVVAGEGGDFSTSSELGDMENEVILRIEIAQPGEVKAMALLSWVMTIFLIIGTFALIGIKYKISAESALRDDNTYFLATTIVCSIFLAILLFVLGVFVRRIIHSWIYKQVWSRRRRNIAATTFAILMMQTINLACMLGMQAYALAGLCNWQSQPVYIIGYVMWTFQNTTFLLLVCMAHSGSLWKRGVKKGGGDATSSGVVLVMDAPLRIHLPKTIIWGVLQALMTATLIRLLGQGYGSSCETAEYINCDIQTTLTWVFFGVRLAVFWTFFLLYWYYSYRTNQDILSRPYAEMRLPRMIYGVQHEQVLPIFAAFTICATLLLSINSGSCWTFVETWMGVLPIQATGVMMAATFGFYFIPKRPESIDQVLHSWFQEFCWTMSALPLAIIARNSRLSEAVKRKNKKLAGEPMFCVELAIKLMFVSKLTYNIGNVVKDVSDAAPLDRASAWVEGENPTDFSPDAVANAEQDAGSLPNASTKSRAMATKAAEKKKSTKGKPKSRWGTKSKTSHGQHQQQNGTGSGGTGTVINDDLYCHDATLDVALTLFDEVKNHEIIYEPSSDTRTILLWGGRTLIVAFKGTSSFENAKTDLNFLKVHHPPLRTAAYFQILGFRFIHLPVMVHKGFWDAWTRANYNERVMSRIAEIIPILGGPSMINVYVTGHSLGGALATLAAHDIKTAHPAAHVTVYTFGQPRVGNVAFKNEYNQLIDEHFAVINGLDPVTRIPPGRYSRVGERVVLLGRYGDLIVRPGELEMHLLNKGGAKISDHMFLKYRSSFMRAIKVQFLGRTTTGVAAVKALARDVDLNAVLIGVGLKVEELEDPEVMPVPLEELKKKVEKGEVEVKVVECQGGGEAGAGVPRGRLCLDLVRKPEKKTFTVENVENMDKEKNNEASDHLVGGDQV